MELHKSKQINLRIIILIICGLLLTFHIAANESYLPIRYYWGWEKVNEIQNNLTSKTTKSLVYAFVPDYSSCIYHTILVVTNGNHTNYWHIIDSTIVSYGCLSTDSIFKYNHYKKTGAIQKEKMPKDTFIPPVISGCKTECVIYQDSKTSFYFEYGESIDSHLEIPELKKYREEWLAIIRSELRPIIDK